MGTSEFEIFVAKDEGGSSHYFVNNNERWIWDFLLNEIFPSFSLPLEVLLLFY